MEKNTVTDMNNRLPAREEGGAQAIGITAAVLPSINYASEQNGVAAVQSITIENRSGSAVVGAQLRISAAPGFAPDFIRHIELLPANESVTLTRPELTLDGEYLSSLTEKVNGALEISVSCGGRVLARERFATEVLAFDEWQGLGMCPELLCSFILPNHPDLCGIISRAAAFMGEWTGDPSMDGYQSQDPNRVLNQAAAVYSAIRELGINYSEPPASFERAGQRVRLADMVLRQRLGSCLDLTLLYAACLEAVGLHPVLIATAGHIFAGVWLEERMFPECVLDDCSALTKRLAPGVNEMAVVETVLASAGRGGSFDEARAAGAENLTRRQAEYIIDVRRARLGGVTPLPMRIHTASGWELRPDPAFAKGGAAAPAGLDETIAAPLGARDDTPPRKAQWERKLLDLGLRNNLINLRMTRTQLPILAGSLNELEDALSDGSDFCILPRPQDMAAQEFSFEAMADMSAADVIRAEFENKRLRSVLSAGELGGTIKGLYRAAKAAMEENGANALYLALGVLRWYENPRSTRARYAPIILLPVEMVRRSAAKGYVIRLRDDEPEMNVTLLEKLEQDFNIRVSGLDPLPLDESGTDIRKVLTIMRRAVMEQPRWDVLETACLGIFSFSQFVMWNDIRNRTDDLMRSRVVRSLIEGRLSWDAQPLEMGGRVSEDDVMLPMPADASQLYAIRAACGGESFVLHGPPGTGKSQTITSLIANALAEGKRVLFVAEKMAALSVVQKRLEGLGIGAFCMELHSNRSRKKDVLEQLRRATEVTRGSTAEEYAAKAEQTAAMRKELDGYARELHRVLGCGRSLYELIDEYERCRDAADIPPFGRELTEKLTAEGMEQIRLTVERMTAAGREAGGVQGSPLRRVGLTRYSQSLRTELIPALNEYAAQLEYQGGQLSLIANRLISGEPKNREEAAMLFAAADDLACWYETPAAWAAAASPGMYLDGVTRLAAHARAADELERRLLGAFDREILEQDGRALYSEYASVTKKWFLPRMMGMKRIMAVLNSCAAEPIGKEQAGMWIKTLRDYGREKREADALLEQYGSGLGALYDGRMTDWAGVEALAVRAQRSARSLEAAFAGGAALRLRGSVELRGAVESLSRGRAAFEAARETVYGLLEIGEADSSDWLTDERRLCADIIANAEGLRAWTAYRAAAMEARALGLDAVVDAYEGGMPHEDVLPACTKALLYGLITMAIDASGELGSFSGAVFNKRIEQYRRMDAEWMRLSRQEAYCRLAARVPNFTREAADSSELGILQRCIRSGGRGVSIRRLFDQIPNLLPRLCPCMLMSPISVAQYLDPGREAFDIVVFDEASQLPTCKAAGVLARGKNAVIVGDPKQMPPTSFFAAGSADEDEAEAEDLESILDDCLALSMPETHLMWHYRSRHESLIAFSNSRFYENRLLTFPSVNDRESRVRLVQVDGVFDRGRTRTNRAEAEAVVQEIRRRAADASLAQQSIGIVTFNISQQHLIDDLLTEAFAKEPALESWALEREEPLFVKNLENVQGDERDVILFSVGFGPDENGRVYMNFGPLNRDGGWRRLNVAVSRARSEMLVFSALRPEQMDLNRTKAEGVAALKSFLEYAAGGRLALSEAELDARAAERGGIAGSIARALREAGYAAELDVGRSKYRMDIGVIDPRDPDKYILGIMLDGGSYAAARTTRDREIAQSGVLGGLGWNTMRIWCMDWWENSAKEIRRIIGRIDELVNSPEQPAPAAKLLPAPEPAQAVAAAPAAAEPPAGAPEYTAAQLHRASLTAEEFTAPGRQRDIIRRIEAVLAAEAPLSHAVLMKRVVSSCGISRSGSRIQSHFNSLLDGMGLTVTVQEDTPFYWRSDQQPESYTGLRTAGSGEDRREVREVPVQEAANAVYLVLHEQVSMQQEDLLRETAAKLGYTRLGSNVISALEQGLEYAAAQGGIAPGENGTFVLTPFGTGRAEAVLRGF